MAYKVKFGSAFSIDQFGFTRTGNVSVEDDVVIFSGNLKWGTGKRIASFLIIFFLLATVLGIYAIFFALFFNHYFCASKGSLNISRGSISGVSRSGRRLRFIGLHPESGKLRCANLRVNSVNDAIALESELKA